MSYNTQDIHRRLKSFNPDERRLAVILIGKAKLYTLAYAVINTMHHDTDAEVRAMAAWALDLMGSVETIPDLLKALYDSNFGVRSNAGWALVHMTNRYSPNIVVPELIDILRDVEQPHARQMAYLVLARIQDDTAKEAIKNYW